MSISNKTAKERIEIKIKMIESLVEECIELADDHDLTLSIDVSSDNGFVRTSVEEWSSSSQYC